MPAWIWILIVVLPLGAVVAIAERRQSKHLHARGRAGNDQNVPGGYPSQVLDAYARGGGAGAGGGAGGGGC